MMQNEQRGQNQMAPKKLYERPSVITFGSVAKLTQKKASMGGDGASAKGAKL